MKDTLSAGLEHTHTYCVPKERTVPFLYPEAAPFRVMPEVFATGYLVGFIEWTCMEALAPYLEEGERTVGTMIAITHEAATPAGMEVSATVRLVEIDGKKTVWEVVARDEVEVIARGRHERFAVNFEKFSARVAAKGKK